MDHLYILWTNADELTFDKMVAMYAKNALLKQWWKEVTLIIWGSTARLAGTSEPVQHKLLELRDAGVHLSACKACADSLGVTAALEGLGIEVKYWGEPLTALLKNDEKLITI